MKTIHVQWCPGMTVREAIADAWAGLELQGYIVLDEPVPSVMTKRDAGGRVAGWSITFPVAESRRP